MLMTSSGHVGKKFLCPTAKAEAEEVAPTRNLVTSQGHVGVKCMPQNQLYRGVMLDPATSAAAKMLASNTLDVRFGIYGEEEEIVELMARNGHSVDVKDVASWIFSGGKYCCIIAERDDQVVACARVSGIRGGSKSATATLEYVSIPMDTTGLKFLKKGVALMHGWGATSIQLHVPVLQSTLIQFLVEGKKCSRVKEELLGCAVLHYQL
jgi:hypothetical protein